MASTTRRQQSAAATEIDHLTELCNQILPTEAFNEITGLSAQLMGGIDNDIYKVNELVENAIYAFQTTFQVPQEPSSVNSASSAGSAGSASTQPYKTLWDESFLSRALSRFMQITKTLKSRIDINVKVIQPLYYQNMAIDDQFEMAKAAWYNRVRGQWHTLAQMPAYAQFQKAENEKNQRIATVKQFKLDVSSVLVDFVDSLVAAKRALLALIDAIPVPPSEITEEMRAVIHDFRLTTVPLATGELPPLPMPNWIDRIGYEMRAAFGMDVD